MEALRRYINKLVPVETTSWSYFFVIISKLLNSVGITDFEKVRPTIKGKLGLARCAFVILTMIVFSFYGGLTTSVNYQKSEGIAASLACTQVFVKGVFLYYWRGNLKKMKSIVETSTNLQHARPKEREIEFKYKKFINKIAVLIYSGLGVTMIMYLLSPIVKPNLQLPVHAPIIGIETRAHPQYEINYLLIIFQIYHAIQINMTFDFLFILNCGYVSMKYDICIDLCSSIGDMSAEYCTEEKQGEILKDIAATQRDILEFMKLFRKSFEGSILGAILSITGVMCFSIVQFVLDKSYISIFAYITQFADCLLYAAVGQIIVSKNQEFSTAVYCSNWYELNSIKNRKMVLYLLTKSQLDEALTIGGFSKLSLQTFTAVMKTSFSLVTFLTNIRKT